MEAVDEIPVTMIFLYSLGGICKEDIPVRRFSVGKLLQRVRGYFQEDDVDAVIRQSKRHSLKVLRRYSPGQPKLSPENQTELLNLVKLFKWKVRAITENQLKKSPAYLHQLLGKLTDQYIINFNELVNAMEGHWLLDYGIINSLDLTINDSAHLLSLIKTGLKLKLIKDKEDKKAAKMFLTLMKANLAVKDFRASRTKFDAT